MNRSLSDSYLANGGPEQDFRYNGKQMQDEVVGTGKLNWLDYGARMYDPSIGRWHVVDPLSSAYHSFSPYGFVGQNPINNREIDGRYFDKDNEKKAARIERRASRRADRLDRKASRREAKGKDTGNLRERSGELRQSVSDINDMRGDSDVEYRFGSTTGREARDNNIDGPATVDSGKNDRGDNVVTMYTESNMGTRLHEARHGGQHARGELVTGSPIGYSVQDEVSAYRAQYSWNGRLRYGKFHSAEMLLARIMAGLSTETLTEGSVNNINQITPSMVNSIGELNYRLYPPSHPWYNGPSGKRRWNTGRILPPHIQP